MKGSGKFGGSKHCRGEANTGGFLGSRLTDYVVGIWSIAFLWFAVVRGAGMVFRENRKYPMFFVLQSF